MVKFHVDRAFVDKNLKENNVKNRWKSKIKIELTPCLRRTSESIFFFFFFSELC